MGCVEGSGVSVLYIGRRIPKGMFSQKQHVSTLLRGHHQASIVMKLKMAVHKQLAHANCLCTATNRNKVRANNASSCSYYTDLLFLVTYYMICTPHLILLG
jgi:hypothetical protein